MLTLDSLTLRSIRVADLNVDVAYQRLYRPKRSSDMAKEFNASAFSALLVACRPDGSYWVIDGQHRMRAAEMLSIEDVPCLVFQSFSDNPQAFEASVFLIVNRDRVGVQAFDQYRAALQQQEPASVALCAIAERCGFEIARNGRWSDGGNPVFGCVSELYKAQKMNQLETVADFISTTFKDRDGLVRKEAVTGYMVSMFANIFKRYGPEIDTKRLSTVAQKCWLPDIRATCRDQRGPSGSRGSALADWFIDHYYNKGLSVNRIDVDR